MSIQSYPTSGQLPAEIILSNADSLISQCIEIAAISHWLYFYGGFVMVLHFGLSRIYDVMNLLVPDKVSLIWKRTQGLSGYH